MVFKEVKKDKPLVAPMLRQWRTNQEETNGTWMFGQDKQVNNTASPTERVTYKWAITERLQQLPNTQVIMKLDNNSKPWNKESPSKGCIMAFARCTPGSVSSL